MGWTVLGTVGIVQWFVEKLTTSTGVFESHLCGDGVVVGREGAVPSLELDAKLVISHPDDVKPFNGLFPVLARVVGCVRQVRPGFLVGRLKLGLHPKRLEGGRMPHSDFFPIVPFELGLLDVPEERGVVVQKNKILSQVLRDRS